MWFASRGTRKVGIGELSLAVSAARGIDGTGVARALHAALQTGFDFVDIAVDDDTERLAGEALRTLRLRDKVIAATRVPALMATRDILHERLPARYIQARVESSLRATKLDAIPLAQLELHAYWRSSRAWPEVVGTCERLVREGKVLQWGAIVDTIEDDTGELAQELWLVSLSLPYSLCERAAAPIIEAARKSPDAEETGGMTPEHMKSAGLSPELVIAAGLPAELVLAAAALDGPAPPARAKPKREVPIEIFARRPLAGGALAGTIGPGVKLKPRDDRNTLDAATLERIAVGAATLAAYVKQTPPAARSCDAAKLTLERGKRPDHVEVMTLAELSLRYLLAKDVIPLPRLHRHELVIDAFAAALSGPLPAELVARLDELELPVSADTAVLAR